MRKRWRQATVLAPCSVQLSRSTTLSSARRKISLTPSSMNRSAPHVPTAAWPGLKAFVLPLNAVACLQQFSSSHHHRKSGLTPSPMPRLIAKWAALSLCSTAMSLAPLRIWSVFNMLSAAKLDSPAGPFFSPNFLVPRLFLLLLCFGDRSPTSASVRLGGSRLGRTVTIRKSQ